MARNICGFNCMGLELQAERRVEICRRAGGTIQKPQREVMTRCYGFGRRLPLVTINSRRKTQILKEGKSVEDKISENGHTDLFRERKRAHFQVGEKSERGKERKS